MPERTKWNLAVALGLPIALIVVLVGLPATRGILRTFLFENPDAGPYLAIVATAAFFPFSSLAYRVFQSPAQLEELQRDFELLGIIRTTKADAGRYRAGSEEPGVARELVRRYKRSYDPWNFSMHSSLAVLLTVLGFGLVFWGAPTGSNQLLDINTLQAMVYGFLGAYIFSVQLVYRRYTTMDLQPTVYMYCSLTIVAGMAFNYVAFTAISQLTNTADATAAATGAEAGILAIVAFSLGYFPYLAINWFNRVAHTTLGVAQRRSEALPLSLIDGISQFHETRLRDEGIDNVQNLASVRLDDLLLNTRFGAQQVIEWVDQAVLYLYLDPSEIESFRRGGVRSISDFQSYWRAYYVERVERDPLAPGVQKVTRIAKDLREAREARAPQLQSTPQRLDVLYDTTLEGPNIAYVENYWRNTKVLAQALQESALEGRYEAETAIVRARNQILMRIAGARGEKERQEYYQEYYQDFSDLLTWEGDGEFGYGQQDGASLLVGEAWLAGERGDYDQAIDLYKQALEWDPGYAGAYNDVAWLYVDKLERNYEEALTYAEKAVELSAEQTGAPDPFYLDTLALVHIKLNNPTKAVELTEQAIQTTADQGLEPDPYYLDLLTDAAVKHMELGELEEAEKILQRVVETPYGQPDTRDRCLDLLAEIERRSREESASPEQA